MNLLENYGNEFSEADVETTKTKLLKGNTRALESMGAKLGILRNITKFDKPMNYLELDQEELVSLTLDDFKATINEHISEDKMFYLVVGDKASQLPEINRLGKGEVIELDIYGNPI
jgi:zinc protease